MNKRGLMQRKKRVQRVEHLHGETGVRFICAILKIIDVTRGRKTKHVILREPWHLHKSRH